MSSVSETSDQRMEVAAMEEYLLLTNKDRLVFFLSTRLCSPFRVLQVYNKVSVEGRLPALVGIFLCPKNPPSPREILNRKVSLLIMGPKSSVPEPLPSDPTMRNQVVHFFLK